MSESNLTILAPWTEIAALLINDIADFHVSANGKKLFLRRAVKEGVGEMLIIDAAPHLPADLSKSTVKLDDWSTEVSPREEWTEIFLDAWLQHRDFLFDTAMRGLDWPGVRKKYEPLVKRVTERGELDDILGMMMSEIGALHSQIGRADLSMPRMVPSQHF